MTAKIAVFLLQSLLLVACGLGLAPGAQATEPVFVALHDKDDASPFHGGQREKIECDLAELDRSGRVVGFKGSSLFSAKPFFAPAEGDGLSVSAALSFAAIGCSDGGDGGKCQVVDVGELRFLRSGRLMLQSGSSLDADDGVVFVFTAELDKNGQREHAVLAGIWEDGKSRVVGDVLPRSPAARYHLCLNEKGSLSYVQNGRLFVQWEPGSAASRVPAPRGISDSFPAWDQGGRGVVFSRRTNDGGYDLYYLPKGGAPAPLLQWAGTTETQPSFSPDHRYLVFVSNADRYDQQQGPRIDNPNQWRVWGVPWNAGLAGQIFDAMPGHSHTLGDRLEIPRITWGSQSSFVFLDPVASPTNSATYIAQLGRGNGSRVLAVPWPGAWKPGVHKGYVKLRVIGVNQVTWSGQGNKMALLALVESSEEGKRETLKRIVVVGVR